MGFPKWKQRLELKKFCRTSKAFIPDLGGGRCAITVYWLKNGRQEAIGTWGVGLEMVRKRVLDKDKAPVESTHKRNKSGPKMVKISWSWGDWKREVISYWYMRKRKKRGKKKVRKLAAAEIDRYEHRSMPRGQQQWWRISLWAALCEHWRGKLRN